MADKDWKTEYKFKGARIAKGLGPSPEEANEAAKRQLSDKKISKRCY